MAKNWTRLGAMCACVVLSSCGSGSSDSGAVPVVPGGSTGNSPTPGPTPAPTPSATPTPSAPITSRTGVLEPTADMSARAAAIEFSVAGNATSDRSFLADQNIAFSYNQNTRSYTLFNALRSRTFGPAEFVRELSVPDNFPSVQYQLLSSEVDYFALAKPPKADPPVVTVYSSYGNWQHSTATATGVRSRLDYFVYGSPTPIASMPRSGKVTFRVPGAGNYIRDDAVFFAEHDTLIEVDFGSGSINSYVSLSGFDFFQGGVGGLRSLTIQGKIAGNSASGDAEFADAVSRGRYSIVFYGPNAEEAGIVVSGGSERDAFVVVGAGIRFTR